VWDLEGAVGHILTEMNDEFGKCRFGKTIYVHALIERTGIFSVCQKPAFSFSEKLKNQIPVLQANINQATLIPAGFPLS